jgi:hypothetical protein
VDPELLKSCGIEVGVLEVFKVLGDGLYAFRSMLKNIFEALES